MNKKVTIGMDLGDKKHRVCVLHDDGKTMDKLWVGNTQKAIASALEPYAGSRVAMETGTHSAWISRVLKGLQMEVLVGNSRKLRAIYADDQKSDDRDAVMLARIARFDPQLLFPVEHRSEEAQVDLELIKARRNLVEARTKLTNHIRGAVKALGGRIPPCSPDVFHQKAVPHIPQSLQEAMDPLLHAVEQMTRSILEYKRKIEQLMDDRYREARSLQQVPGVGPVTALTYVLTLERADRFTKSRTVGAYLGLTPRRSQSGDTDKQLRITKAGNSELRQLLVGCAQYIMGVFGPDCELRRFGERIAQRGGKNAKKRAVVAVARKLAVMLHRLWADGVEYEPFYLKTA